LPHPLRVFAGAVAGAVAQLDQVEHLVDLLPAGVATVEGGQQFQVRPAGEIRVQAWLLDEAGNSGQGTDRIGGGVAAEEADRATVAADQAEQHAQGRCLPGPVRAEEAIDVAALDGQVDPVDRGQPTVALDETAHLDRPRLTHLILARL